MTKNQPTRHEPRPDRATIELYRTTRIITDRQAEILQLRRTFSQNTIAQGLHISRSTVRSLERTAHEKISRHTQEDAA